MADPVVRDMPPIPDPLRGYYNPAQPHGAVSGYGPNYASSMMRFKARQRELGRRGIWRSQDIRIRDTPSNDGKFIDIDWCIL